MFRFEKMNGFEKIRISCVNGHNRLFKQTKNVHI